MQAKNKINVIVIKIHILILFIITLSNKQIDNSGYELHIIGWLLLQIWHDGQNNSHGTMYMYTQKNLLALLKKNAKQLLKVKRINKLKSRNPKQIKTSLTHNIIKYT